MSEPSRRLPPAPPFLSRRGGVLLAIVLAGAFAYWRLGLTPAELVPHGGGMQIAKDFFAAALTPAVDYEAVFVPESAPPFLVRTLEAVRRTLVFASAGMALALVGGLVLGFLASSSAWTHDCAGSVTPGLCLAKRSVAGMLQATARVVIALARSVHELLWAVVFLAAFGLNTATAVVAIAIPFAGVLAKVFSELLDEASDQPADSLRAVGATPLRAFLFGRLPLAVPDMAAYGFYRFECAVRSSAVLGFFGFETLGYYIRTSFENLHYREVWTYLYALIAIVLVFELWSASLRRRVVI